MVVFRRQNVGKSGESEGHWQPGDTEKCQFAGEKLEAATGAEAGDGGFAVVSLRWRAVACGA